MPFLQCSMAFPVPLPSLHRHFDSSAARRSRQAAPHRELEISISSQHSAGAVGRVVVVRNVLIPEPEGKPGPVGAWLRPGRPNRQRSPGRNFRARGRRFLYSGAANAAHGGREPSDLCRYGQTAKRPSRGKRLASRRRGFASQTASRGHAASSARWNRQADCFMLSHASKWQRASMAPGVSSASGRPPGSGVQAKPPGSAPVNGCQTGELLSGEPIVELLQAV